MSEGENVKVGSKTYTLLTWPVRTRWETQHEGTWAMGVVKRGREKVYPDIFQFVICYRTLAYCLHTIES